MTPAPPPPPSSPALPVLGTATSISLSLLIPLITIGLALVLLLSCIVVLLCRRRRHFDSGYQSHFIGLPQSQPQSQGDLSSKLWIGNENPTTRQYSNKSLTLSQPSSLSLSLPGDDNERHTNNLLIASMLVRSLQHECSIITALPDIGHRSSRSYYHVNDSRVNRLLGVDDFPCLLSLIYTQSTDSGVDYHSTKILTLVHSVLASLSSHPSLLPVYSSYDTRHGDYVSVIQPLSALGSLRDYQHNALYSLTYTRKYFTADGSTQKPGRPLSLATIRVFFKQIVEGVRYLNEAGLNCHVLHSGNVILVRGSSGGVRACLSFEGLLFGFKSRIHRKLKLMKSHDPLLTSLAFLLYEMATGIEASPTGKDSVNLRIADNQYSEVNELIELLMLNTNLTLREIRNHRLLARGPDVTNTDTASQYEMKPKLESKMVKKLIVPLNDYYSNIYRKHPSIITTDVSAGKERERKHGAPSQSSHGSHAHGRTSREF